MSAAQLLDQVQTIGQVEGFEARAYADRLAQEIAPAGSRDELAARDEVLRDALGRIEALVSRVMRIRLDHVLAADTSIGPPTRKVFAATVASYAGRLELLETRVHDVASKTGARDAHRIAELVVQAAAATLDLRAAIRDHVLALGAALAAASIPHADQRARDRQEAEPARRAWSQIRRELEATAARPERLAEAPFAPRLASWPEQLDEPDPVAEPTRASLLELD